LFFRDLSFDCIYKEDNMEADILSKNALLKMPGQIAYSHWEEGNEGPSLYLKLF